MIFVATFYRVGLPGYAVKLEADTQADALDLVEGWKELRGADAGIFAGLVLPDQWDAEQFPEAQIASRGGG
jgi:hypothetical protein